MEASPERERVRTVEVVATLSLATDLSIGVPLEHGLHSALIARRLCDEVHADQQEATEAFYAALLFYIGCTGTALTTSGIFGDDDALTTYATPVDSIVLADRWREWRARWHHPGVRGTGGQSNWPVACRGLPEPFRRLSRRTVTWHRC
jgi:hypothetical protein